MKILQIIDSLNVGGAEKVFVDLCNLLLEHDEQVTALVFKQEGILMQELNTQITQLNFKRKNKFSLIEAYEVAKLLRKYDVLHVHLRQNYRYIKFICLLFNPSAKVLLHDHYGKIKIDKSVPVFFKSILKPKYYIGVDSELTEWAIHKLKIKEQAVFLLSNIVIKKDYKQIVPKKGIVLVGNIKPLKNQLFAIRLLPFLKEDLTIIGNIQDQNYYDVIIKEIKMLSLQKRVSFVHNSINVQEQLRNYKFALSVSKSESGPLILAEYLAQSLPFIAYETGEMAKILKEKLPQSFLSSFDTKDWLNHIKKLSLGPDQNFTEIFKENFSSEIYITKCKNIYQKIISS